MALSSSIWGLGRGWDKDFGHGDSREVAEPGDHFPWRAALLYPQSPVPAGGVCWSALGLAAVRSCSVPSL